GIRVSARAFHRLVERATAGRGAALGAAMALQAYFCGYYAVFVALMIALATLVFAALRRAWTDARYWTATATAAAVAVSASLPIVVAYIALQRTTGFARSVDSTREFAAHAYSYGASLAYAHRWFAPAGSDWRDPLFPGFAAL